MFQAKRCGAIIALLLTTGCTTTITGQGVGSTPAVDHAEAYTAPATDLPAPERGRAGSTGPAPEPNGPDIRWAWSDPLPFGWAADSPVAGFDVLSLVGSTCGISLSTARFDWPPTTAGAFDLFFESLPTIFGYSKDDDALVVTPRIRSGCRWSTPTCRWS